MPTIAQIDDAEVLNVNQASKLLVRIRASDRYRENRAAYPDIEGRIKAKINRLAALTDATNTTPIVITSAAHGYANNDTVMIRNVLGNLAANGSWVIANVTTNSFELKTSIGNGVYVSGGEVLDYQSKYLSAIIDDLNPRIGEGTVAIKGAKDGVDYSQLRDKEDLIIEALDLLYDSGDAGAIVAVGQRDYRCCSICGFLDCCCEGSGVRAWII